MTERRDGDRIIVTGYSGGSHYAKLQAETVFSFEADGTSKEGPFHIAGSVYGKNIRLRGAGQIDGSVLCRGDLRLENHTDDVISLRSGVSVNGNLVAVARGGRLQDSLVAGLEKADYILRGDVVAQSVTLENAVIFGNLQANNVKLTNCLVFGAVIARERLQLTASTCLYYHSAKVIFEGPCTLIHAMGESHSAPTLSPYQDGAGQVWEADLRFYPVYRGDDDASLMNRPWESHSRNFEVAKLALASDWVRVPVTKERTGVEDGQLKSRLVEETRHVLSITGRALNFKGMEKTIENLYHMLATGLEFDHYHPETKAEIQESWADICTPEELKMMTMVTVAARS